MNEPRVLLTGFEPFANETVNPSLEIARRLHGERIAGHRVVAATLPVSFADAPRVLEELLSGVQPALVIALGQAGGRSEIALERVAVNLIDARIPDNAGAQPVDAPVIAGAPGAYFSTLPLKAMRARLHAEGIPAALSLSAGSFVCNQVFYALAHRLATSPASVRGGFIHVPWLPHQATAHPGAPSMALETMIDAVRTCIHCALTTHEDLAVADGATH